MSGFDKEQLEQLRELFDQQRSAIMLDTRSLLDSQLQPIKDELKALGERMDRFFTMESEDVVFLHKEVQLLKTKLKVLEAKVAALKR